MVLAVVGVVLMDGNHGMNDLWLVCLLVDDWLHCLVDVVVVMCAQDRLLPNNGMRGRVHATEVLEFGLLLRNSTVRSFDIVVDKRLADCGQKVMSVLCRKNFLMAEGLDGSVVMMLVNLPINSLCNVLFPSRVDMLPCHCW